MSFKVYTVLPSSSSSSSSSSYSQTLHYHRRAITLNILIVLFLILYTLAGGYVFLHFELEYANIIKENEKSARQDCIERLLRFDNVLSKPERTIAKLVTDQCMIEFEETFRHEWNYKTAALYGFGILTTLGYGKIEPRTRNGRIFAVMYGFFGIPFTVILLTNLGRYLERIALRVKRLCIRDDGIDEEDTIKGSTLFSLIVIYLIFGAILIPLLEGQFDFFNGIYFAFICLTAIEYGDLVPSNNWYIPIVIVYVCVGLAISTIALDIGSIYVRKLHYLGRKIGNIANVKIWFGSRDLRVHELVNAIGHNIGLQDNIMNDIDIDYLVHVAIQVKEGRLLHIPQTHIVEGIWPPELVPLFIKDGNFPQYVDSDDKMDKYPIEEDVPKSPPPIPNHSKRRNTVRFEDEKELDVLERRGLLINNTKRRSSSPPPSITLQIEKKDEDNEHDIQSMQSQQLILNSFEPIPIQRDLSNHEDVSFADE